MKNGQAVAEFERAFAEYVNAKYAIALCNGTATLHTALVALGVKPGDRVAVPPLTMSATTIAVLHAGAVPVFRDVDARTWLMEPDPMMRGIVVSLYGLHAPWPWVILIDDAAQTLRPHGGHAFTSYSFQASKILPLGEGGMLVTNDEELATRAREFSSLGYRMRPDQPRIDPAMLKSPTYERHHTLGWNYRMSDLVAERGLAAMVPTVGLRPVDHWRTGRRRAADLYRQAIAGCSWLTPQHVPDGWQHDYWAYTVALQPPTRIYNQPLWGVLADRIEAHGGERPYAAWRLTYQERAFAYLAGVVDRMIAMDAMRSPVWRRVPPCPVAEDLQPRLMQFQTNNLASAERNAEALRKAIREIGG